MITLWTDRKSDIVVEVLRRRLLYCQPQWGLEAKTARGRRCWYPSVTSGEVFPLT